MAKIPLAATIAHAYRFAFGGFLKVLSVVWLPWLVTSTIGFSLSAQATVLSENIATGHFAGAPGLLLLLTPFYLLALYLFFMQVTGVTQQALGLRSGSAYYYLSFAKPVWRLIGATLLAALIVLCLYLAFVLIGVMALTLARLFTNLEHALMVPALIAVAIALVCAYAYILVRLTFLINPVVIAESRISFRRGWSLSKGNFWRIVLILVAVLGPVTVVFALLFQFWYGGFPPAPLNASADQIGAANAARAVWLAASVQRTRHYWYMVYPGYCVLTVVTFGLFSGAQSFAYRALVPETPASTSPP